MKEKLTTVTLNYGGSAGGEAGNAVATVELPFDAILVGASAALDFVSGSPTGVTVDIEDDGTVVGTDYTAIALGATAGAGVTVKSTEFGGTVAPIRIAADSEVDIDVNIAGGSTPKASVTVVLWLLV